MKVLPAEILLQLKIEVFDLSASVLPEDFQPPSQVSTGGGGEVGYMRFEVDAGVLHH